MFHWGQGTMFKALAHLTGKLGIDSRPPITTPAAVRMNSVAAPSYVIVTPARNEKAFIGDTIRSVASQTCRPLRWIIVSDGSTDGTDDIIKSNAAGLHWIELMRMPERRDRQFAAKANAFNAGYERLKHLRFDLIGNLDADITFAP